MLGFISSIPTDHYLVAGLGLGLAGAALWWRGR